VSRVIHSFMQNWGEGANSATRHICLMLPDMEITNNSIENIEFDPKRDPEILEMMRKIYPHLSDEELIEARENLKSYLRVAFRIASRMEREASNGRPPGQALQ